jgi:phage-related protein (TIGR01555 family)
MIASIADGLRNFVANIGTERDKAAATTYTHTAIDVGQLSAMYRGSAIAKKIVNLPAEDACREWREWQADAKDISAIEVEEGRLGLARCCVKAMKSARLFGGAAIYIGTNDRNPALPLNPERIQRGGLRYITVIERDKLTVKEIQRDPREPGYGLPSSYTMQTTGGSVVIHPSRLALFQGDEVLDERYAGADWGWSDSVLISCLTNVRDLDATMANIASLVFEAKVDVIGIPDLMEGLKNGGKEFEDLLLRRTTLAQTGKGINGTLITDAAEEHSQKTASFANLPNVADRFMQMTSAASGIPMSLLFGMSPGGLNATGDADTRGYYDRVKVLQSMQMQPAMQVLDECLIRSALGERPADIFYNWRPLWQPTTKEIADTGKVVADTFKTISDMAALPDDVISEAIVNALTEVGIAPGLEGQLAEYFAGEEEEVGEAIAPISDAAPRTLYVRRDVVNGDEILAWAMEQGFEKTLTADDLHVTIAFSRTRVDWMKMGESWEPEIKVPAGGARLMEEFGEARVLLFNSSELGWRHEQMKRNGATWDHEEYQPHITISYDEGSPDLADVEPYRGEIVLGPEIFEEVNEDWLEKVVEQ